MTESIVHLLTCKQCGSKDFRVLCAGLTAERLFVVEIACPCGKATLRICHETETDGEPGDLITP